MKATHTHSSQFTLEAPPAGAVGWCVSCDALHTLPRTNEAENAALSLLADLEGNGQFSPTEEGIEPIDYETLFQPGGGKMFGVLACEDAAGQSILLRSFSGQLSGHFGIVGYAGPVASALENGAFYQATREPFEILRAREEALDLETLETEMAAVEQKQSEEFDELREALRAHKEGRQSRRKSIDHVSAEEQTQQLRLLEEESRADKRKVLRLREKHALARKELKERLLIARNTRDSIRTERKALSRQWTEEVHLSYRFLNFQGETAGLRDLLPNDRGVRSGTGECCAPKLLQQAAKGSLTPRGIAELWVGAPSQDGSKKHGHFYEPCEEKCAPLLGFLLCGLK